MARKKAVIGIIVLVLMVSLLTATGCLGCWGLVPGDVGAVVGSGKLETREMDYSGFTRLDVGSAFEVDIARADSYRVSITADDNLFQYLDVKQRGETLHIGLKQPWRYVRTTRKATITMPDLYGLELSGASRGKVSGFSSSHSLELDVSGASSLEIDSLEAGDTKLDISGASKVTGSIETANCEFNLSGASRVELEGSANDIDIEASGASRTELAGFRVNNADVELSGASSGAVTVSGSLDVDLSGASRLDYYGNPSLGSVDVSGSSKLNRK